MDGTACAIQFGYLAKAIWDTVQRYRGAESHVKQIRLDYDGLLRSLNRVCDFLLIENLRHRQWDEGIQRLLTEAQLKLEGLEKTLKDGGGERASFANRAQLALNPAACEKLKAEAKNIDDHLQKLLHDFNR